MRRAILLALGLALVAGTAGAQGFIHYEPPHPWTCSGTTCTLSGVLLLQDGSATAPSLSFANGTNTGLWFSATGLRYSVGGTHIISMDSRGIFPNGADTYAVGLSTAQWKDVYVSRTIQGSKSKALADNSATSFVRIAVADDDYEGGCFTWTAFAEDTATDARQTRSGHTCFAINNNSGTEAVVFSTGDSAVQVTAGTLACTFDGNSAAADTIDLRATCDTSLAATTTLTFEYRLDLPSTTTVTPQ